MHNLRFILRLMENIRQAILEDRLDEYQAQFYKDYYGK